MLLATRWLASCVWRCSGLECGNLSVRADGISVAISHRIVLQTVKKVTKKTQTEVYCSTEFNYYFSPLFEGVVELRRSARAGRCDACQPGRSLVLARGIHETAKRNTHHR